MTTGRGAADGAIGRRQVAALIALVAIVAGTGAGLFAKGAIWEGWVIDRLLQVRAVMPWTAEVPDQPVVVIGLDQNALESELLSPLPRVLMTPMLAQAGQGVLDAGALALGYDFVFAYSAEGFRDPRTGEARLRGFDQAFLQFLFANRGDVFIAHTEIGVPHRTFSAGAGTGGVRAVTIETESDGMLRRHSPVLPFDQSPHFIDAFLGKAGAAINERYAALPLHRLGSSIPYLSLIDVLRMLESKAGKAELREFVEGRIVLMGGLLPFEDEHYYSDRFLPVLPEELAQTGPSGRPDVRSATAGVFILADLVGSALTGRIAVNPPQAIFPVLSLGFAVAGACAALFLRLLTLPFVMVTGVAASLGLGVAGLEMGVLLFPGVMLGAWFAALAVAVLGRVGILQRRQRSLVRLFGHYLAPDVIREMAQSEQLPELGGETRHVVVAFLDIAGFTKMSEQLEDQDVVRLVNVCFDSIGQVITKHEGYIDKYIGDAIMAVWNAPNTVAAPEKSAVDAAMEIIALLDHLREVTGQPLLDLRIALHAGPVLVGDIGGMHRRSFTVMGTTVNTASRIEAVAKDKKVRLAFSQTVAAGLPETMVLKELWTGQLRGLSEEVAVFTVAEPGMFMAENREHVSAKAGQTAS